MSESIKQRLRLINAVGTAAVVSILAGTVALGVYPMYSDGVNKIRKSAELDQQVLDLDSLSIKLAKAEVERASREGKLIDAESRLPSTNGMNQFVQELAKVAEEAGLQVDGVIPSRDLKDVGAYKLMTVQLSGRGDWDTCYRFLTGMRGVNRKLTRLDSLTLEAVKEKPSTCRIDVAISTFIAR